MATKKNSPATAGSNPANGNHATAAEGGSIMVEPCNTGTVADLLNAITPELGERELRIEIWRDQFAEFEGTAAQLRTERLIPDGFEWPRAAADRRWEANGFKYWLRRTRPAGWKGLMKSWFEVDNWFIRIEISGRSQSERNHMGTAAQGCGITGRVPPLHPGWPARMGG